MPSRQEQIEAALVKAGVSKNDINACSGVPALEKLAKIALRVQAKESTKYSDYEIFTDKALKGLATTWVLKDRSKIDNKDERIKALIKHVSKQDGKSRADDNTDDEEEEDDQAKGRSTKSSSKASKSSSGKSSSGKSKKKVAADSDDDSDNGGGLDLSSLRL